MMTQVFIENRQTFTMVWGVVAFVIGGSFAAFPTFFADYIKRRWGSWMWSDSFTKVWIRSFGLLFAVVGPIVFVCALLGLIH